MYLVLNGHTADQLREELKGAATILGLKVVTGEPLRLAGDNAQGTQTQAAAEGVAAAQAVAAVPMGDAPAASSHTVTGPTPIGKPRGRPPGPGKAPAAAPASTAGTAAGNTPTYVPVCAEHAKHMKPGEKAVDKGVGPCVKCDANVEKATGEKPKGNPGKAAAAAPPTPAQREEFIKALTPFRAKLGDEGGKQLLTEFQAKKLSDIPADQYAAVVARANEMLAESEPPQEEEPSDGWD